MRVFFSVRKRWALPFWISLFLILSWVVRIVMIFVLIKLSRLRIMKIKEEYGFTNDNQFYLWKISSISNWKKKDLDESLLPKKEPLKITDAEALMDDLLFPHKSSIMRLRSIQLSLKQTRILTTLLPDEIINIPDLKTNTLDSYVGVLLFADVSGFTALCEKYNDSGKNGTDKLTATLNNYIGAMVEVIYSHGGDVLKFSGDAFLALWKVKTNEYVYSVIHRVLSCALYIQHTLGLYETEAKVLLRVKLGISAGNVTFSVIGDDSSKNYLIVGSPVHEVKAAEHICSSGEVILSLSAWGHLSPVNYQHLWKDNDHIKVTRIIYDPENTKREVMRLDSRTSMSKLEILHRHLRNKDNFRNSLFKKHFSFSGNTFSEARLLIDDSSRKNLGSDLRMFVIPPVIQQIDADLPLEYLSEMRNVTSMFINIVPQKLQTKVLIDMVHKAYIIISDLVYKAMGSVNKVSLFDKDVMLLIIFGLRGFNHEGEVAASLQCAYDIKQACGCLEGVSTVSVGVTTGQAYCGVVGHPLRREYTVIGASVNKAARIMIAYPGKVTCDRDTFLFSNLASSYFTLQEQKPLKGIESVGPIYEFTQEKRRNTWAAMNEGMYPILGREVEMKIYQDILKNIENPNCNERAILIKGSARIGKTRLMDEMILEAHKNGFQPIIIALHGIHSAIPYGTAQYIIKQILDIPDSANSDDKERRLSLLLGDYITKTDLFYLNEIMNVKFPSFHNMDFEDPTEKFEKMKTLFKHILQVGTKSIIFAIDDIDYCDQLSWDLLMNAINEKIKFLVMTMPKRSRPGISQPLVIPSKLEPHVVKMTLQGLPSKFLPTLACQFLNVKAISPELVSVLVSRSNGNPGWCESFLVSLCQSNTIIFDHLTMRHVRRLALITPPTCLLTRTPYAVVMSPFEKLVHTEKSPEEKSVPSNKKPSGPSQTKEKGFLEKIKAFQLHRRNARDETIVYTKTHRPPSMEKILQAYEDLQQTIERIRVRNTSPAAPVFCDVISEDDLLTEHIIAITEKSKDDEEKNSDRLSSDMLASISKKSKSSLQFLKKPPRSIASVGKICDDTELDFKLKEIFSRFPSKRRDGTGTIRFQEPAVTQSLHSNLFEKSDRDVSMFCKSAHALLNSKSIKFGPKEIDIESDDVTVANLTTLDEKLAFFHSLSFWKPYTEELIEESIKIFAENKKESDRKSSKKHEKHFKKYKNYSLNVNGSKSAVSSDFPERIKNIDAYSEMDATEGKEPSFPKKSNKSIGSGKNVQIGKTIYIARSNISSAESEKSLQEKFLNSEALDTVSSQEDLLDSETGSKETDSLNTIPPISGSYSFSTQYSKSSKITIENKRRSWISKVCSWMVKKPEGTTSTDTSVDIVEDDDEENIQATLINPSVKLEEVQTPECFAGIIMSAFDCLSPYEQLMLKCGSIIGEKFTRKMLNALMHNPNPVLTSEGIRRLFEMRILCCGSDSLQSVRTSSTENLPRCMCDLSYEEKIDEMLPKYAFCRVLTFKYAMFRSTLYELLPLSQKKEFHIRAVEYLESEPVICSSCDRPRWVYEVKSSSDFSEESLSKVIIEENSARRNAITSSLFKSMTTLDSEQSVVIRPVKKLKQKRNESITQFTLPNALPDYRQCECLTLQADVHQQLIAHCVAAGLKLKQIKVLINYSSIMISLGDLEQASKLLKEAETMCKSALKSREKPIATKKELKHLLGKTLVHNGQIYLEKRELKKASRALLTALKHFNSKFIPIASLHCLQHLYENIIQYFHSKYPSIFIGKKKYNCENREDISLCLSLLSNVFMLQGRWELASLVALRSLNNLQKSNTNLIELCNAYSNVIDIFRHFGRLNYCKVLEKEAASACVKLFTGKSTLEMIALGRLICSVFNFRLIAGSLHAAARLGDQVFDIGQRMSSKKLGSYIIPQSACLWLMLGKIRKSVSYIMDLSNREIWYHILCLDFILETGFSVEDASETHDSLMSALEDRDSLQLDTYLRALAVSCLWKIRSGKPFDSWCEELFDIEALLPGNNFGNMITALKILEFNLLRFSELNRLDKSKHSSLIKKINGMFDSLEKVAKAAPVILPRLLHLRAYYQYKTNNLSRALSLINQAKKLSYNQGNAVEFAWISHNRKVWTCTDTEFNKDFWTDCAKDNKYLKWTDSEDVSSKRNVMYTLQ